jgi:Tol biopolymer transport system component
MARRPALATPVVIGLLGVLGWAAGAASASFPGRNGEIVYRWQGDSAYRAGPSASSIRAVNPRSARVRVLRDCPLLVLGYTECTLWAPRYSPDGQTLAFPMVRIIVEPGFSRQLPGLGRMASDGSRYEEHPSGATYWLELAWSPSGDRLLLERYLPVPDYNKPPAIFLASLDGAELGQVTPAGSREPDWSSNGWIAFTSGPFTSAANVKVKPPHGAARLVTHRGGRSASWSPHGTKLAFVRDRQPSPRVATSDVYVVRRDGSDLRRLTRRGGSSPRWSPDGRWIAFTRDSDLYVVRAAGGHLRRLVNASPPGDGWRGSAVTDIDWQPLPRR